ncbi:helix-turn-helix domain-containing protein [Cronobacter sakazakii]|nr:helix-turn-helix domain-containing protein [Cronobacter sakazakii]
MTSIYSNDYQLVIKALRDARIACGITQQEVASAFGRPQSFIAKVESGERRLDVVEFIRFCRAVNVDPFSVLEKLYKNK